MKKQYVIALFFYFCSQNFANLKSMMMEKQNLLSLLAFMALPFMYSCSSDDSEELLVEEEEEVVDTRGDDYYYSYQSGTNVGVWYVDNKSYIVFHSSDKDIVLSKLQAMGIDASESKVMESDVYECRGMFEVKMEGFYKHQEYLHMIVDENYEKMLEIPEVSAAFPCLYDGIGTFPMTDLFYCYENTATKIEKLAKENGAWVIGKIGGVGLSMWVVACDRNSRLNTYDMVREFSRNGLRAEPAVPLYLDYYL